MSVSHVKQKREALEAAVINPSLETAQMSSTAYQAILSLTTSFLGGVGSVVEFFPSPARFDRWRMSEQIPFDAWPEAVRGLLELENGSITGVERS